MLGTAIRKGNRVRSLSITSTITSLSSIEVGVRVVIRDSISVGIRGGLIGVGRGVVGWSSMDYRGMVGWGSMDNWSSMVDRGGMVSWSMSKHSLGSMETVRRVSNSSNSSTKCLGLGGAPVLSLVGLGHGLVG